ncbi:MAG: CARDB domain-containing protein [Bacteroidota bacterium]
MTRTATFSTLWQTAFLLTLLIVCTITASGQQTQPVQRIQIVDGIVTGFPTDSPENITTTRPSDEVGSRMVPAEKELRGVARPEVTATGIPSVTTSIASGDPVVVHSEPYIVAGGSGTGQTLARKSDIMTWSTIMTEDFGDDGSAFNDPRWQRFASAGFTNAYWGDVSYYQPGGGPSPHHAWCAARGTQSVPVGSSYPANMRSWMIFGPFDLSDADDARLSFLYRNISEVTYDTFGWYASIDGTNFNGTYVSGDSYGFQSVDFDLKNVTSLGNLTGRSQVWIAFLFKSDGSNQNMGAWVDDVVLRKNVSGCDLEPNTLSLYPAPETSNWRSGCELITGSYTERNNGAGTALGHYSEIYLYNGVRRYSLAVVHVPAISAYAASQPVDFSVTLPATIPDGVYEIRAEADMNGAIYESDESNNIRNYASNGSIVTVLVQGAAELAGTTITTSSDWEWTCGEQVTISVTVANNGRTAAATHSTRVVLSRDGVNPLMTLCDVRFPGGIPAMDARTQMSSAFAVPQLTDGNYYIGVHVDVLNEVDECDESNNDGYGATLVRLSCQQEADLAITASPAHTSWIIGTGETVAATETNLGAGACGPHQTYLYLSQNPSANETLLDAKTLAAIPAGGNQPISFGFSVPTSLSSGMYYLIAVADVDGNVSESNRANNRYVHPVQIQVGRTLAVLSPGGAENWFTGSLQQIRWTSSGTQCVNIDFSSNNGSSWSAVVSGYSTSTGSFDWTIPNAVSSQCRIRVRDCSNSALSAQSALFAISTQQGRLALLQNRLDFGTEKIGRTKQLYFTIRNDGNGSLNVGTPVISGTDAGSFRVVSPQTINLAANAQQNIYVEFNPSGTAGLKSATLTCTTSDPSSPQAVVQLSGTAESDAASIVIPISSVTFSVTSVGWSSSARDVLITNSGAASVTVYDAHLAGVNPGDFTFNVKSPGSWTIPAGQSIFVSFVFTPQTSGSRSAEFIFQTTDPKYPSGTIYLYGNGTTDIAAETAVAESAVLMPNYPNPFRNSTTIRYSVSEGTPVTIRIHDATGSLLTELLEGYRSAGEYTRIWDAGNLPAGTYYCVMSTAKQRMSQVIHLIH